MHNGFGNIHLSEARPDALPKNQNSPQKSPYGLYAEQISGSAFTRSRHRNYHTWVYRTLPSVSIHHYHLFPKDIHEGYLPIQPPEAMRFLPFSIEKKPHDFIEGLTHVAGNNAAETYIYHATASMTHRYLMNRDGEMLFIPVSGNVVLKTELGNLSLAPGMIGVIPRGIIFSMDLTDKQTYGYLCENKGLPFTLPELGVLGANGLANPRHFLYPDAAFESINQEVEVITKYQNRFWTAKSQHSPLNVVAWTGNYAPYTYDLSLFNTMNTVSFDHPDPSIFTVLMSESEIPGISAIDFVIFPPRYMIAEHTFRPPYFHRNIMSELMGLIEGEYDAKREGFLPGGISIHNAFTPHGPDKKIFEAATNAALSPEKYENTLAFMLESNQPWLITPSMKDHLSYDKDYPTCWEGFERSITV